MAKNGKTEVKTDGGKTRKPTKAQEQAEMVMNLLKKGPVSLDQLRKINSKYPGDPISYVKKEYKVAVFSKKINGVMTYSLTDFDAPATKSSELEEIQRSVARDTAHAALDGMEQEYLEDEFEEENKDDDVA